MTNRNILLSAASAGVLSAALLGSGVAFAATTVTVLGGNTDANGGTTAGTVGYRYATQALTASNGAISQTSNFLSFAFTSGDNLAVSEQLTVTLPTGFVWTTAPTATLSGTTTATCGSTAVLGAGVISGTSPNQVTFSVSSPFATGTNGCTVTLSNWAATTGTALTSVVTSPLAISAAVISTGTAGRANSSVGSGFTSASGWTVTAGGGAPVTTIDVSAAALGKTFTTASSVAPRVANLGTITLAAATPVYSATSAAYAIPGTATFNPTITAANLGTASRFYFGNNGTGAACSTTVGASPTGSVAGTISGSTVSASGLGIQAYALCYEANGTSVIQESTYTGSFTSSLAGTAVNVNTGFGSIVYPGAAANINYAVGGSAWQYFVRVTNPGQSSSTVLAVITTDAGVSTTGVLATGLGANTNALYSVADINAATGLSLGQADRFRVQVVTSNTAARASGVLFNTATGVITAAN